MRVSNVHGRGRSAHLAQAYHACPPRPGGDLRSQRRHDCDRLEPRVTSAAIAMGGVTDKSGVRLRPPRAPEAFRSVVPMHL